MSKIGELRARLRDLLAEHRRDRALPTSARFLYYELVQRRHLSKERNGSRRPDQILHEALFDLREDGSVPWDWIVDETRELEDYTGYPSIKDGALNQLQHIRIDPWPNSAPLILTESRSLAGVLRGIVSEYRCRISATNGQCGGFLRTDIAPTLMVGDHVLYLGDFDHAGNQIEANTRGVLEREIGELEWERLALTREQVDEYHLPTLIKHDRRYRDGRPHDAVETEALSQTVLMDILRTRLEELLPELLESVQERERRERDVVTAELRGDQ